MMGWIMASERNLVATFLVADFIFACVFTYFVLSVIEYVRSRVVSEIKRRKKLTNVRNRIKARRRAEQYGNSRNVEDLAA